MKPIRFKTIYIPENKGLGNALREAIAQCDNELIARMDSDDIANPRRFELQLKCFLKNTGIDIVGGNITEFVGEPENIVTRRTVPVTDDEIKCDMKRRCAMNHMSVMYRKEAVQKAGGYQDWPWNEDYYLWIRMIEHGCVFENIPYDLVNVRIGNEMSARRGGWKYFRSEQTLQKYMLEHKMISIYRYLYNVAIRFGGEVLATNAIRNKLFKIIRKKGAQNYNKEMENEGHHVEEYPSFSVAMSVYGKDRAEWFDVALCSVINQTVAPNEIVLVIDGPVPDDIQKVIEKYSGICG